MIAASEMWFIRNWKVSEGESLASDRQRINLLLVTEWLHVEMNACGGVGNNSSYNLELINVVQLNP